ncbi:MAG: biotin transport system permease protein [Paracoccaceae bacterium]|jgi:biotin transport system permease protein
MTMLSLTSDIRTIYHPMPARWKLGALCAVTLALSMAPGGAPGGAGSGLALAITVALYLGGGMAFARQGLRMLRPLRWFLVLLAVWHVAEGTPVAGAWLIVRLVAAVGLANLVTMTTRLDDMIAAVEGALAPLRRIGLNPRPLGIAIALTVRFIPALSDKGARLVESWRARSPRRPGWRMLFPLALIAIDDADAVSDALRARGGAAGPDR